MAEAGSGQRPGGGLRRWRKDQVAHWAGRLALVALVLALPGVLVEHERPDIARVRGADVVVQADAQLVHAVAAAGRVVVFSGGGEAGATHVHVPGVTASPLSLWPEHTAFPSNPIVAAGDFVAWQRASLDARTGELRARSWPGGGHPMASWGPVVYGVADGDVWAYDLAGERELPVHFGEGAGRPQGAQAAAYVLAAHPRGVLVATVTGQADWHWDGEVRPLPAGRRVWVCDGWLAAVAEPSAWRLSLEPDGPGRPAWSAYLGRLGPAHLAGGRDTWVAVVYDAASLAGQGGTPHFLRGDCGGVLERVSLAGLRRDEIPVGAVVQDGVPMLVQGQRVIDVRPPPEPKWPLPVAAVAGVVLVVAAAVRPRG
ncbi:MAG TPA: hypothetical protein VFH47_01930 [Candidatus Thermoplasmatota archaeon]|nr:hypothetical protein [Candidatus Thermoplasmatota archaeon]